MKRRFDDVQVYCTYLVTVTRAAWKAREHRMLCFVHDVDMLWHQVCTVVACAQRDEAGCSDPLNVLCRTELAADLGRARPQMQFLGVL